MPNETPIESDGGSSLPSRGTSAPQRAGVDRPAAIVLGLHGTGLRTARCLAEEGIEVHSVALSPNESGRKSKLVQFEDRFDLSYDDDRIIDWLAQRAAAIGGRPVVFPICDEHAIAIARHRDRLDPVCRTFQASADTIERIVSKDGLYSAAEAVGAPIPPAVVEPTLEELDEWCRTNAAPYFAKPYYQGLEGAALEEKNRVFSTADELRDFVRERGSRALIVQRMLRGGDGWIFDCYGYCDASGRVVTMASHRRIRQLPIHTGTTCYGEIPASPRNRGQEALFELTSRLLDGLGYHGIFGIEWLQDQETDELYLLDFNARPFSTVNHLKDCGLNLPFLAYRELTGEDISGTERTPHLTHKTWIGMNRDLAAVRKSGGGAGALIRWIGELAGARSYAFFTWSDPGPGLDQLRRLFGRVGRGVRGET